jgi:hypothetical protein
LYQPYVAYVKCSGDTVDPGLTPKPNPPATVTNEMDFTPKAIKGDASKSKLQF